MYYAMMGTLITVVVGIAVSLAFPLCEDDVYDEKLLHPLVLKWSKLFPGRPRRFLKKEKDVEVVDEVHTVEKASKELDNPVFELSENIDSVVKEDDVEKSDFSNSKDEKSDIIKNFTNVELNRKYGTRF